MLRSLIALTLLLAVPAALSSGPTGAEVIAAFKKAGLEAEAPTRLRPKDYGHAPYVCKGTRFLIPSIGNDAGGRVFECATDEERDAIAEHYQRLGKLSATMFSWVLVKGRIVVQINSDLDEEKVEKYRAALP